MEDDEVAAFLFIQTSISHINTLHNCRGSHYSRRAGILSCARALQLASERSKKMPLTCPCPDKGSMASSYRPQVLLSFCLREKIPPSHVERPLGRDRRSMCASHCIIDLPCCSHLFRLPTQKRRRLTKKGLIHKNLCRLQLNRLPA